MPRHWKSVALALALLILGGALPRHCEPQPELSALAPDPPVVAYSAEQPGLHVVAGRVIAETDPTLSTAQRHALWREYGLIPEFEWVRPVAAKAGGTAAPTDRGFTYHELRIREWTVLERIWHVVRASTAELLSQPQPQPLPSRQLPLLLAALNEDRRLHWACPDALILVWADSAVSEEAGANEEEGWTAATEKAEADMPQEESPAFSALAAAPLQAGEGTVLRGGFSAGLLNHEYRAVASVADWEAAVKLAEAQATADKPLAIPGPLPEFEYYRFAAPDGTAVEWAAELTKNETFARRCEKVFGTNQARALADYKAAGSPALAQITVCIADTGVLRNHPELADVMHPNALDCNYSSLRVPAAGSLAGPNLEVVERERDNAAGLPREAIRGKPAGHGTNCAGVVMRCTAGFGTEKGQPAVRLLAASLKSDKTIAFDMGRVKTPISSFIRLVYALKENFPTGSLTPAPDAKVQNSGDVRVVSVSASVPKSMFSDAQWRIVANLAGKAAGAIAEDLRTNDRLYVFAAGNEAQSEPNKPADVEYVLSVSAARAMDGSQAWYLPQFKEGSNVGAQCVSAPGEGILTSAIFACPNLRYLPADELRRNDNWSTPRTGQHWVERTLTFSATSSATPQVASLAALLYAQDSGRRHLEVIELIRGSTAGRVLTAPYGSSGGLIDFARALNWKN